MNGISVLIKEVQKRPSSLSSHEDPARRCQLCPEIRPSPDIVCDIRLDFPVSGTVFISHLIYGILLQHPKWIKIGVLRYIYIFPVAVLLAKTWNHFCTLFCVLLLSSLGSVPLHAVNIPQLRISSAILNVMTFSEFQKFLFPLLYRPQIVMR